MLFEHLTVAEHLWFFASLKKTPPDKIRGEVENFVKSVGLEDKKNCFSHQLSGRNNCYRCEKYCNYYCGLCYNTPRTNGNHRNIHFHCVGCIFSTVILTFRINKVLVPLPAELLYLCLSFKGYGGLFYNI